MKCDLNLGEMLGAQRCGATPIYKCACRRCAEEPFGSCAAHRVEVEAAHARVFPGHPAQWVEVVAEKTGDLNLDEIEAKLRGNTPDSAVVISTSVVRTLLAAARENEVLKRERIGTSYGRELAEEDTAERVRVLRAALEPFAAFHESGRLYDPIEASRKAFEALATTETKPPTRGEKGTR